MNSKAYNLMWVSPAFLESDAEFFEPIPAATVRNIRNIAANNPDCDVILWVDAQRLTLEQCQWVRALEHNNLQVKNLREIGEYRKTPLYNDRTYDPNWRRMQNSLIWQVGDLARVLVCVHTLAKYDQVFYSDADITGFKPSAAEIQSKMERMGFILAKMDKCNAVEAGLFGFSKRSANDLNVLHSLVAEHMHQGNGWPGFYEFTLYLKRERGVSLKRELVPMKFDGTQAEHPHLPSSNWQSAIKPGFPQKGSGFTGQKT